MQKNMKKTILMVLAGVFAMQMNAQINEVGRFYITPKVGYNNANISIFDKYGAEARSGINAGISGEYAINEMLSIEPGIFYSMQGTTIKVSSVKLSLNNDYINIPILVKAYVADGLNIFAGPQFGYLINSRLKLKTGNSFADILGDIFGSIIDMDKYEKNFDFSISVGLGYQLESGLSFSANYNIGLTNVPDAITLANTEYTFNPDAKNNVLQVNIGYRF
jgi:hypothetical protein